MSVTLDKTPTPPSEVSTSMSMAGNRLPRFATPMVMVIALAAAGFVAIVAGWGLALWLLLSAVLFLVGIYAWSRAVENRRSAVDRLMTGLVWSAFLVALVPLASLIYTVVSRGAPQLSSNFLSYSFFRTSPDQPVGIYHAIIGTLIITAIAVLIAVPVGIFAAIYLVEYGKGNRLAKTITFLVDVMTGIPSIVAGLFAFALFTLIFGAGYYSGFGGSVALSLLMIPIVVRSSEEMLRLVPDELREAAYALGVPKWRTITKVVLPTALGGIVTGVTLATARIIGETAPLLLIASTFTRTKFNPFDGQMQTLPVLIYSSIAKGTPVDFDIAWGAALVLIVIVMVLNLVARIVGRIFAPAKS